MLCNIDTQEQLLHTRTGKVLCNIDTQDQLLQGQGKHQYFTVVHMNESTRSLVENHSCVG